MNKSYKTQLKPNREQISLFKKHLNASRFAFNWALGQKKESFDKKDKTPSGYALDKIFNKLKKTENTWLYEVSNTCHQEAIQDCDKAFQDFFRRCKKKQKGKKGFPKFKSKRNDKQSFRLKGFLHATKTHVKLPRIGWVRLKQRDYLPQNSKILSATVSHRAGRWFVSLNVEEEHIPLPKKEGIIGVDLGIKHTAVCSDGQVFESPKPLAKYAKKLLRFSLCFVGTILNVIK